jgi:hypothetical protein
MAREEIDFQDRKKITKASLAGAIDQYFFTYDSTIASSEYDSYEPKKVFEQACEALNRECIIGNAIVEVPSIVPRNGLISIDLYKTGDAEFALDFFPKPYKEREKLNEWKYISETELVFREMVLDGWKNGGFVLGRDISDSGFDRWLDRQKRS